LNNIEDRNGPLVLTQRSEPVVSVTDNDGTRVEAPGTKVESDSEGTRVQAPGVDITVPKGKDSE